MAGALWKDARDALVGLVEINQKVSRDGVDLHFLNDSLNKLNVETGEKVREMFESVKPFGETPTGRRLQDLFDLYLPRIENDPHHRPIHLVVITDGVPTDEPEDSLITAAMRLDRNQLPPKQFGVLFMQIGDDFEATDALEDLANNIFAPHGCRDIVTAFPYNPGDRSFTERKILKVLIESIDEGVVAAAHNRRVSFGANTRQTPH